MNRCSVCGKEFLSGLQDSSGALYCSEKCFETTLPRCSTCGKLMRQWVEDESGNKYCSNSCFEKTLPHCANCGKPMQQWIETKNGKKYCNEHCLEMTLPKCVICRQSVNGGLRDKNGRIYCSDACFEQALPVCAVCGKRMRSWYETDDGKRYCSDACFESILPKCAICGKPIRHGIQSKNGKYYCSEECYERILPRCKVCGKPVRQGWMDDKGHYYCSEICYETTLPLCDECGKPMKEWLETSDGHKFCCNNCLNIHRSKNQSNFTVDMESPMTAAELAYITSLGEDDCERFMNINHLNGDQALEAIDIFMDSLNHNVTVPTIVASCVNKAGIYSKMAGRLSAYNTMRGGTKGYGGFVFEEMHAADVASKGVNIQVLGNNGPVDFVVVDAQGNQALVQAKAGYKPHQIDWSKYKDQKIVVDKGNTALAAEARSAGLTVEESAIYKAQADCLARAQQWESRLTGQATAPITAATASAHYAGLASAKLAARVGVPMHLGENIYDVLLGTKSFEEAAAEVIVDSVVIVGGTYLNGAALCLAGNAMATLGSTAVGTAVAGAATGVATVIGSTAVGGAVVSGVTAVAAGIGTAVGVVSSAPLLPVVLVGTAVGFIGKWLTS